MNPTNVTTMARRSPQPVLDTHVHLWDPTQKSRAVSPLLRIFGFSRSIGMMEGLIDWIAMKVFPADAKAFYGTARYVTHPYLPSPQLETDIGKTTNVVGYVHVEADWQGDPVDETKWLLTLQPTRTSSSSEDDTPKLVAIVARADLEAPDVGRVLDSHLAVSDLVVGIRQVLYCHPSPGILNAVERSDLMSDVQWRLGFEELGKRGLAFETVLYSDQLEDLANLTETYPDQKVVLCHGGLPVGVAGPFQGIGETEEERAQVFTKWKRGMQRLAASANVTVKISGLLQPCCGFGFERRGEDEPVDVVEVVSGLRRLIDFILDTFGPERCMFGSNFPVEKASVSYNVLYEAMVRITDGRSDEFRRQLFHDTAVRHYRIDQRADTAHAVSGD